MDTRKSTWTITLKSSSNSRPRISWGDGEDLTKRHTVDNLLNECLGWTGNGHCDGGDIGSGTINSYSFVVDANIAKETIVAALRENNLLEGAIIAVQRGDDYQVLWPEDFDSWPLATRADGRLAMIAPTRKSHSALVTMELRAGEVRVPLAQLAHDFAISLEPIQLPPCEGEILLAVDGQTTRMSVWLPEGVRADQRRIKLQRTAG